MSKNSQYKRIRREEFLKYISGEMSDRERHEFERILQKDLFASDAEEGLSSGDAKDVREDLSRLQNRLDGRTGKRTSAIWIRVAASVAVLVVLGTLYFTVFSDRAGRMNRMVTKSETTEPEKEETKPLEQTSPAGEAEKIKAVPEKEAERAGEETERVHTEPAGPRQEPEKARTLRKPEEVTTLSERAGEDRLADTELSLANQEIAAGKSSGIEDTSAFRLAEPVTEPRTGLASAAALNPEDSEKAAGTQQAYLEIQPRTETSATLTEKSAAEPGISGMPQERQMEKRAALVKPSAVMIPDSIPAQPIGGWEAFNRYLEINMRVPQGDSLPQAVAVRLHFFLDPEGHPQDIEIDDSPGEPFSTEAIRLLREGPSWSPAVLNGVSSRGPIPFRIEFRK